LNHVDRQCLKAFAVGLASSLGVIALLFVLVDALEHLDEIVEFLREAGLLGGTWVVAGHYAARLLLELSSFGEVVALVPAVIVLASMARANEFVPLLAAGESLRRAALPVFCACAGVGVALFATRNLAGPSLVRSAEGTRRIISRKAATLGSSFSVQGRDRREDGRTRAVAVNIEEYDPARLEARGFSAQVIEEGAPFLDVRAPVARWDDPRGRWLFPEGGEQWSYERMELPPTGVAAQVQDRRLRGAPSALVRVTEFSTALGPDLIEAEELGPEVLSLSSLFRQRARTEMGAALHSRLARIIAPLALALAALPLVLTTDPRRVLAGTVKACLVAAAYELAAYSLYGAASEGYVPGLIGGWAVPLVFGGAGAWLLASLDT
jgi:lipopolysaccharide export LptBFGC system permease protein LptF